MYIKENVIDWLIYPLTRRSLAAFSKWVDLKSKLCKGTILTEINNYFILLKFRPTADACTLHEIDTFRFN